MRVHFISHAVFESLGAIEKWVRDRDFQLTGSMPYKGEVLPDIKDIDFLCILGGPQSSTKIEKFPYLQDEINYIKQALDQDKYVFGVCLGAQLIGEALGAKTEQSPTKEVGVYPVTLTESGQADQLFDGFPKSFDVSHWHYDMPGIADGVEILAESKGCPRQAYRYGKKVVGTQCHFEFTLQSALRLIKNCPEDLSPGEYTQTVEELSKNDYCTINQRLFKILDRMIA